MKPPSPNCIECNAVLEADDIEIQAETCKTCWRMWYFGEPRVIAAARAVLFGCKDDAALPHGWPMEPELVEAYAALGYVVA